MANIWRRIPSGKLSTNKLLKKSSGAAGGEVADDFFENAAVVVDGVIASSQAEAAEGSLLRALDSTANPSQAQSAAAALARTLDCTAASSQVESAAGAMGMGIAFASDSSQAQSAAITFARTIDSGSVASQAQSAAATLSSNEQQPGGHFIPSKKHTDKLAKAEQQAVIERENARLANEARRQSIADLVSPPPKPIPTPDIAPSVAEISPQDIGRVSRLLKNLPSPIELEYKVEQIDYESDDEEVLLLM